MPRPKQSTFKERLEKRIIEKLTINGATITGMAELIGENYYTVRRIFKSLEDAGLLEQRGWRNGSAYYHMTAPDSQHKNNSIPVGPSPNGPIKLSKMLDLVGKESKSSTALAAVALPRNMARILMAALRNVESNGAYDIEKNLGSIRLELTNNLDNLKSMVKLYEAVLQADVLWDPFKIKAVPYDYDFDREAVIEAYRHYYPED